MDYKSNEHWNNMSELKINYKEIVLILCDIVATLNKKIYELSPSDISCFGTETEINKIRDHIKLCDGKPENPQPKPVTPSFQC